MRLQEVVGGHSFRPPACPSGESFGTALARFDGRVVCVAEPSAVEAAGDYLEVVGCARAEIVATPTPLVHPAVCSALEDGAVPIAVFPATLPGLKEVFFRNPSWLLFADHLYRPSGRRRAPSLFTVGTTNAAAARLASRLGGLEDRARARRVRRAALRARFGPDYLDHEATCEALRSAAIHEVRVHGLGPRGTNISRACAEFVECQGLAAKAKIIIHERKVEPLEYAEIAARETSVGIVPLHVECAVFYDLHRLFETRRSEVVFAAHHYMQLDEMQLAARSSASRERDPSRLRIASHPSPRALADPLVAAGAEVIAASSNADAAELVRSGEADVAVTTESAKRLAGLETLHRFGSPTMLFTFGTPLGAAAIMRHLESVGARRSPRADRGVQLQ